MKTSQLLGGGMFAAFLLFGVSDASGNGAVRRVRPPPQEIAPTTQAHLETATGKLASVLDGLRDLEKQGTAPYRGFLEETIADVLKAQANIGQAFTYLREHPEINVLVVGPPTDGDGGESRAGHALPYTVGRNDDPVWVNLDQGLYQASSALWNVGSGAAETPVLGEIGGFRGQILADLTRARRSLGECRRFAGSYRRDSFKRDTIQRQRTVLASVALSVGLALGGLYVVSRRKRKSAPVAGTLAVLLLLSGGEASGNLAPRPVRPPPQQIAPTTQAHLEVTKGKLDQVLAALQVVQKKDSVPYGGYLEHTIADVMKAQAEVAQAFSFLKALPEFNALRVAAVPLEAEQPLPLPYGVEPYEMPGWLTPLDIELFLALEALTNRRVGDRPEPVLGDLGGHRKRIVEGVARARASLREGGKAAAIYSTANPKAAERSIGRSAGLRCGTPR